MNSYGCDPDAWQTKSLSEAEEYFQLDVEA